MHCFAFADIIDTQDSKCLEYTLNIMRKFTASRIIMLIMLFRNTICSKCLRTFEVECIYNFEITRKFNIRES